MDKNPDRTRRDGWTLARRTEFLGALRATGSTADACAWVGMSQAGFYALVRRDPVFAAARDAALAGREADRDERMDPKPPEAMDNRELMRRLRRLEARRRARPRGIVAQQKSRRACSSLNFDTSHGLDLAADVRLR